MPPTNSQCGANRTVLNLKADWYWYGMTSMTRTQITTCGTCQTTKWGKGPDSQGRRRLYCGAPWQVVSIDLEGPMSETPRKNRLFSPITRWAEVLLKDVTVPVVTQALHEHVFSRFGIPTQLHSDQGTQFELALMTELCALWGVDKTHSTPITHKETE